MVRLVCVIIGYLFGLFQTGYLYGKMQHVDIRKMGSGNAGSTNALRVLGVKAGAITFFGDFMKCILAIVLVRVLFKGSHSDMLPLLSLYAGIGATLGHNFPFYLKFKGGKGIAVLAGLLVATNIWMTLICLIAFVAVVYFTRYISAGSLLVAFLFALQVIIYGAMGVFHLAGNLQLEMDILAILVMALAWYRHRANIQRLLTGTENKFSFKKKS
ncbi:MAG: glycerol-3-phosphate 1-O-acyltransferase PlsY [Hespellia sp.]|nr:glycerol-3-phosphate 1-O-acyltransferase PlsY [Hespellia sp.]